MIFVLWTYSGWHEAAYIVAEVKDRARNIPLALMLGTVAVTVIYLLVNAAYLFGLGFEGRSAPRIAANLLGSGLAGYGARRDQLADRDLRARRHQRHDLHDGAHLLGVRRRPSPVSAAEPLEPTLGDAGARPRGAGTDQRAR